MTVATLAGKAAITVAALFDRWRLTPDPEAIDHFCMAIRANASAVPVLYFAEWVDRWLMGGTIPGPGAIQGKRFQATSLSPGHALAWAGQCGRQFAEHVWMASRLREAATCWETVAEQREIIVIREVSGASISDDEVRASLCSLPAWLSPLISTDDGLVGRPVV
jgi:hypothetical protein